MQSPDDVHQTASVLRACHAHRLVHSTTALWLWWVKVVLAKPRWLKTWKSASRLTSDIVTIRPLRAGHGSHDQKGKTFHPAIAEAIAAALTPAQGQEQPRGIGFRQVHDLLKSSRRAGRRHLLVGIHAIRCRSPQPADAPLATSARPCCGIALQHGR